MEKQKIKKISRKVCTKEYPKGTREFQLSDGFSLHPVLKQQIDIYLKNVKKDWDFTIIISGEGEVRVGKCQPKGSKVLMANGEWKNIEEININEKVLSPNIKNGKIEYAVVKEISNYFSKDNYAVYRKSTKEKLYECSGNHLIPIIMRKRKHSNIHYKGTETIIDNIPANQLAEKSESWFKNESVVTWQGFFIDKFDHTPDPKIDPYSFGLFLGDGHFRSKKNPISRNLGITNSNLDSINYVLQKYPALRREQKPHNKAKTYYFSLKGEFALLLSQLGLEGKGSGEKFLPNKIKRASADYRLKVLAGLIDSDGYVDKRGIITYTTKSKILANDIITLCRSLGGNSRLKKIKKEIKSLGFSGEYWNIQINLGKNQGKIPLINKFKKNRLKKQSTLGHIPFYIEKIESKEVYGIVLNNESKLYITDNFCVTHNSVLAMQIAAYWTQQIKELYKIKVPFNLNENFVFNGIDLVKKGNKLGVSHPYSALIFDEAGADLEGVKSMKSSTKAVKDFFRECGQYNLLNILVIPEFFDLPKGIALSRSSCMINVYWIGDSEGIMNRGYFKFYSRPNKKYLYLKGKKDLNYNAGKYDFYGSFSNFYTVDEKEYRKLKREALRTREKITTNEIKLRHWIKGSLAYMYDNGLSYREIATEISTRGKLKISYQTVGNLLVGLREEEE